MRVPAYGRDSLADLLPSVGAHLGVPGAMDVLGLPDARRYVVLLVDGLGWELLGRFGDAAGALGGWMGRPIDAGAPSTTATSLASLGTGLPPGGHGIAGYSFRYPPRGSGFVLNALAWPTGVSGLDVQPRLTYLERLGGCGVSVAMVAHERFARTGLTTAVLRGARLWGVSDEDDLVRMSGLAAAAAAVGERSVTYVYVRALDHEGHGHGVGSPQWLGALGRAGALAGRIRASLPDDTVLLVTGDHGMVQVPAAHRVVAERCPGLLEGVTLLAGEARFRHVYADEADVAAVRDRWAAQLGERAWVRTRAEAVAEGWFGEMAPGMAGRFGDVVVAMRDDYAVLTDARRKEWDLVGMHGSLTDAEIRVPLIAV